jgi:hypothetical protein
MVEQGFREARPRACANGIALQGNTPLPRLNCHSERREESQLPHMGKRLRFLVVALLGMTVRFVRRSYLNNYAL